jgi:iron complex outermembrane receptor protein
MRIKSILAVSMTLAVAVPSLSAAQSEDDSDGLMMLEEVIVTAQRREQSLQDVPISITAFTSSTIEQNNMRGAADYLSQTVNVTYTEEQRQGANGLKIAIRGISDLQDSGERVSATSAFGVYVDEFSIATAARGTPNPPMYDVERIEILRGPQGTYFGRNSTGGAINVTTKQPTDTFFGQVDLGFGSFGTYEIGGVLNLPVTDTFFLRTAIYTESNGGQVENVSPLSDGGDSSYDHSNIRISTHWDITDQWAADFSVNVIKEDDDMANTVSIGIQGRFGSDLDDPLYTCGLSITDESHACRDTTGWTDLDDEVYNLRVSYIGDSIGFKSITGRADNSMDQLFDLDQSGRPWVDRKNDYEATSVSQEFRLFNVGDGNIDWTVGVLAYDDELVANNDILILDFLGPWMAGDSANQNTITMDRDGWAVFADVSWHINDAWTLTVGGRYSDDKESQIWTNTYAGCANRAEGDPLSPECELRPDQVVLGSLPVIDGRISGGRRAQTEGTEASNDSDDFSPRVALNWAFNDQWTAYGIFSQGYKPAGARANPDSGGVNSSVYDKEKLTNFELGAKGVFNGGRTSLDVAVFTMTWDDMQTTVRETFCRNEDGSLRPQEGNENCEFVPLDTIQNANEASASGLEISLQTLVGENWLFAAAYGYLDAKYEDFQNAVIEGELTDISGYPLPNAPEHTAALSGTYNFPFLGGDSYVRLEANYRSEVWNLGALGSDPLFHDYPFIPDAYWLVNLRAGVEWDRNRLTLGVTNLLDEDYAAGVSSGSAGVMVRPHEPVFNARWTTWFE